MSLHAHVCVHMCTFTVLKNRKKNVYFKTPVNPCPTVQRTKSGFFVVLFFKIYFYYFIYVDVCVCGRYVPVSGGTHSCSDLLNTDAGNQTQVS